MEDVILLVIIIVEEALLKATGFAAVAVGLMEMAALSGLRTLLRDVSMCCLLHTIFSMFCNRVGNTEMEWKMKGHRTCQ